MYEIVRYSSYIEMLSDKNASMKIKFIHYLLETRLIKL